MKKEYLNDLRKYLAENNVPNIDKIMEKYERRYEFGLEADLSEEEIEKMLGTKEEIFEKYRVPEKETTEFKEEVLNYKKNYNLIINAVSDDIVIDYFNEDKIKVFLEDIDPELYKVNIDNENGVLVDYAKLKFFGLNRKKPGKILIKLPEGKVFDKIKINTASGDILTKGIESNTCYLTTASGDYEIGSIICNSLEINTVSGDFEIDKIKAQDANINSVSGDLDIMFFESFDARIDSVSGDIEVKNSKIKNLKTNSISGDIIINNEEYKNFGKKVKGVFKNEI